MFAKLWINNAQYSLLETTNYARFTFSVGDYTNNLQLVLSKRSRIGDTKYNVQCRKSLSLSHSYIIDYSALNRRKYPNTRGPRVD
jgi:hypothetical protein